MKVIIYFSVLLFSGNVFAQGFEVKENSGLNKLERINSIETYMVKMESSLNSLKKELTKTEKSKDYSKVFEELKASQEKIKEDIESLKTGELTQLKKDINFLDQEKVEKLIDKFVKYEEKTEKRIKFLEATIKDIYGQLNTVATPKIPQLKP